MKFNPFFLALLVCGLAFQACNNDDDNDDTMQPSGGDPITEQNVRAVFNFLPPSGYEATIYEENLPAGVTAVYKNQMTDQNIQVAAVENLTGEVIQVTDAVVESSFINPVDIIESTVNGTTVYESMEESSYRVVIFRGQYVFNVMVPNDPDPAEAETEVAKFIELIADAMSTF